MPNCTSELDQTMTLDKMTCPDCGNDRLYQLGDGRFKCRTCRRKFTPNRRRSRLNDAAMGALIAGFAEGTAASEVAAATGLNLKTVHHYYARIRDGLATDREQQLADCYGSALVAPDLFERNLEGEQWRNAAFIGCLIDRESEIELLFADDSDTNDTARIDAAVVSGWIVAADHKALETVALDRIFCLPGQSAVHKARSFWLAAKRRLTAYCGGFKNHFRLYLREMEFRHNIANKAEARDRIGELLERKPISTTGEEDA